MKTLFYLVCFSSFALITACNQNAKKEEDSNKTANQTVSENLKLQVFYFHVTNRCATCNGIEANVRKVLETNYAKEMRSGEINFKSLNVDEQENKALAEKYQAYGASLHLVKIEKGQEKDNDLTDYAFTFSRPQPEVFLKGMKDTIQYFL